MRVEKQRPARGKLIEVRRLHLRVPTHAPDPVIQVIDGNEQDVWFLRILSVRFRNQDTREKENE
jgi:hypothetical protein